jgi:hypothetical protein
MTAYPQKLQAGTTRDRPPRGVHALIGKVGRCRTARLGEAGASGGLWRFRPLVDPARWGSGWRGLSRAELLGGVVAESGEVVDVAVGVAGVAGVIGAVIGVATLVYSAFADSQRQATQGANDFADALREDNGVIGEHTRAVAADHPAAIRGARGGQEPRAQPVRGHRRRARER